jgi:hypothetical protein
MNLVKEEVAMRTQEPLTYDLLRRIAQKAGYRLSKSRGLNARYMLLDPGRRACLFQHLLAENVVSLCERYPRSLEPGNP